MGVLIMKKSMKKIHKKAVDHLKEDIKGYKKHRKSLAHEIKEDKELIKALMPKKRGK